MRWSGRRRAEGTRTTNAARLESKKQVAAIKQEAVAACVRRCLELSWQTNARAVRTLRSSEPSRSRPSRALTETWRSWSILPTWRSPRASSPTWVSQCRVKGEHHDLRRACRAHPWWTDHAAQHLRGASRQGAQPDPVRCRGDPVRMTTHHADTQAVTWRAGTTGTRMPASEACESHLHDEAVP